MGVVGAVASDFGAINSAPLINFSVGEADAGGGVVALSLALGFGVLPVDIFVVHHVGGAAISSAGSGADQNVLLFVGLGGRASGGQNQDDKIARLHVAEFSGHTRATICARWNWPAAANRLGDLPRALVR